MRLAGEPLSATKHDLAAEVLRHFGELRLRVTGSSMLPAVWPGDLLTIRRQSAAALLPGAMVLCHRDGKFILHRLVATREDGLITRGDAQSRDDAPFAGHHVLGEVVAILRNGRPVSLSRAWWHRAGAWIVRHSDLCTWILLRLRRWSSPAWAN